MKAIWTIIALLVLGAQPANAQQVFGIAEGTAASALNVKRTYSDADYSIIVPGPDPEFESYMVTAPPGVGVCRITALGVSYTGANAERDVLAAFARVRASVEAKYGNAEFISYRKGRSSESLAAQIFAEDAAHAAYWPYGVSASTPPVDVNVKSIGLNVEALENGELYLSLRYEFRNFTTSCKQTQ